MEVVEIREYDEVNLEFMKITGYDLPTLKSMFLTGWQLTPPNLEYCSVKGVEQYLDRPINIQK